MTVLSVTVPSKVVPSYTSYPVAPSTASQVRVAESVADLVAEKFAGVVRTLVTTFAASTKAESIAE